MKKIILFIPTLCIVGFITAQSIGPSTLNTAGGNATIGSNTFEYSIGEMAVVSTNTAGTITITHGILQPNANKADNISDIEYAKINLNIYPNPASNEVNIAILNNAVSLVNIQLYDITGKMIQNIAKPVLQNGICRIAIAEYAVGNYLLKVSTNFNDTAHQSAFTISKSN